MDSVGFMSQLKRRSENQNFMSNFVIQFIKKKQNDALGKGIKMYRGFIFQITKRTKR